MVSLWCSWVSMTHWAWDCLWALPAWGRASPTSAQTDTVSLSFVSGCPPPPLHPSGCGLCSPGKPAPAAGRTGQESGRAGTEGAGASEHGGQLTCQREQLAAPGCVVPCQALLLSGLLHRDPCRLPADMQDALLSLDVAFSDTVSEPACLPDLVLSQHLQGSRLWPLHPVVCDLHPLCLPLLVSTHL